MVSEDFLYFIWQFQYFGHIGLKTTNGEPVQVLHPGYRNRDSGPDFTNARLLIGAVEWAGTVEIHCRPADWYLHRHQHDRAYDTVILHVVWEDSGSTPLQRPDGTLIPTLVLKDRTDAGLLGRYQKLLKETGPILCAGRFGEVDGLHRTAMLDAALLRRLERKAEAVRAVYAATGQDWEETVYRLLATAFGFKVNAEPFERLARTVSLKYLQKHRDSLLQVEALLFGTAGLLEEVPEDEYVLALRREHRFLASKYGLTEQILPAVVWKWAKLRPAGFPTLRLAQLARLVVSQRSLSGLCLDENEPQTLLRWLQVTPSDYWQTHYRFGKTAREGASALGEAAARMLLINVVAPVLAAYAEHRREPVYLDRAVALLESLPPEDNRIIRLWQTLGLPVRTAFDSQAALELYNQYCLEKRCLSCRVGAQLMRL
ncbi:DUF2851 family protein [Tellurirhabdus rosea]|uniref:DUF2851 family protein n=1 Tax=Tellurirhabdus rosea TaxID=2674997 RepID=UPI00225827F6|nr:DUF2851 family protein [Tellurirhabdus rosea]